MRNCLLVWLITITLYLVYDCSDQETTKIDG
jgi:hypothetical protein